MTRTCAVCGRKVSGEPEWTPNGEPRHPECYGEGAPSVPVPGEGVLPRE